MAVANDKPSILFCLPSGLGHCSPDIALWLLGCGFELGQRGLVSKYGCFTLRSSRILCNRNMFAEEAIKGGWDYLCMVDPDMRPDLYARPEFGDATRSILPTARPFLSVALEFLSKNPFSVIGAPACCDPPNRYVNVFRAREDGKATRVTHEEAYKEVTDPHPAVEQVAAIGTGLIMIPTPVFTAIKRPFFDDEYEHPAKTEPSRTQDIYFTENCSLSGIGVFCAWMCWAGHHKDVVLGCPGLDKQWFSEKGVLNTPLESFTSPLPLWHEQAMKAIREGKETSFGVEIGTNAHPLPSGYKFNIPADAKINAVVRGNGAEIGPDASWRPPVTLSAGG